MEAAFINPKKKVAHESVMLKEVIDHMNIKEGGHYLDCTFGAGGYSRAILNEAKCYLTAIDQDPGVQEFADIITAQYGERFRFIGANFSEAAKILKGKKFDGIVLDLGVSSMQLDQGERGFSFQHDGRLDMRMGSGGKTAAEFINTASEGEIADVIYKYGEETKSRQIAKLIVNERASQPIETTFRLAEIVRKALHYRYSKIDLATKTFQAIRIYINKELDSIEKFLRSVHLLLAPKARIIVVSFHSLEDSIIKNFFKEHSAKKIARSKYSSQKETVEADKWLKTITKKPLVPSQAELKRNPRCRSAKLRVAERLGESGDD